MDILLWFIIITSFILSFIGLVYPIIPSVIMIWIGIVIYHFGINPDSLSWFSWTLFGLLTIFLFVADYLVNLHFVDRVGGSTWGKRAAMVGLIVGSFVIPPFGVILVPFCLVLITEFIYAKSWQSSFKIAFATFIAFLSGTFAKAVIQFIMITAFVLDAIF
ncbi:DUF456 domain-containing protein [Alteribacillus iranensis]|uniref:DUF456 domain-containing protein n=1 Tax=Alteribacillus iranensis TaxID=930128 RepID=A0A1I2E7A8_9BACI|nr:DUF456 domain-containing protein [Alteribacillus iranensis]SFE88593.1 hypothetical protein SAMN05192532_105143 [Alteribacillus iranensis]